MAYGSTLSDEQDGRDSRKMRGAFFTPPVLAAHIASFAIQSPRDLVLEPACGEAEFLSAATRRLTELGAPVNEIPLLLRGVEIHDATARAARKKLRALGVDPVVDVEDFFCVQPDTRYDAIIGNPPFIRYQGFVGPQRERAKRDALAAGVRLSSLSSSWAPFVVHAMRFLKPGGRLGFVLPAELLRTNYAKPVRDYIIESFAQVEVVSFDKLVFPEVQEGVVLLLASGFGSRTDTITMRSVAEASDSLVSRDVICVPVAGIDRWPVGRAGLDAARLLEQVRRQGWVSLSEWGKIRLGAVTGSNRYFTLDQPTLANWNMSQRDVIPLCPPGSRHLRTLDFTDEDLGRLTKLGKNTFLFYPQSDRSSATSKYISYGEKLGIDEAYKCRVRDPWWKVPGVRTCDAFVTYMNDVGPNICANVAGTVYLNSVHGLTFASDVREIGMRYIPLVALSTIAQLSAETYGRSYGGGVLKLEPRESGRMLVPSVSMVGDCADALDDIRSLAASCLEQGDRGGATDLVDRALCDACSLVSKDDLHEAQALLRTLRQRRAGRSDV